MTDKTHGLDLLRSDCAIGRAIFEGDVYKDDNAHLPESPDEWHNIFGCNLTEEQMEEAIGEITWGTYGPDGKQPCKYIPLKDLDTEHLENILIFMSHPRPVMKKLLLYVLKKRYIEEHDQDVALDQGEK